MKLLLTSAGISNASIHDGDIPEPTFVQNLANFSVAYGTLRTRFLPVQTAR